MNYPKVFIHRHLLPHVGVCVGDLKLHCSLSGLEPLEPECGHGGLPPQLIQQPSVWDSCYHTGMVRLADNLWLEPQHHFTIDIFTAWAGSSCSYCFMGSSSLSGFVWLGIYCANGPGPEPLSPTSAGGISSMSSQSPSMVAWKQGGVHNT